VNVGSGEPVQVGAIAEGVARRIGRHDLLQMEDGPASDAFVVANVDRLRTEVGWQPRFTLDAGLDDAVAWWSDDLVASAFRRK
jgi:UDP-glucuronate decarboxylase